MTFNTKYLLSFLLDARQKLMTHILAIFVNLNISNSLSSPIVTSRAIGDYYFL